MRTVSFVFLLLFSQSLHSSSYFEGACEYASVELDDNRLNYFRLGMGMLGVSVISVATVLWYARTQNVHGVPVERERRVVVADPGVFDDVFMQEVVPPADQLGQRVGEQQQDGWQWGRWRQPLPPKTAAEINREINRENSAAQGCQYKKRRRKEKAKRKDLRERQKRNREKQQYLERKRASEERNQKKKEERRALRLLEERNRFRGDT